MKACLFLAALCPAVFGFELSRDTLVSKFTGGDSVWLINRSAQPVRVASLHAKLLSGRTGNGLVFDVSNVPGGNLGMSHYYFLQADRDSLFVPTQSWNSNPAIIIPPRDSIHIKNIIYGDCIFCVSLSPPFDYAIELRFVESGRPPVKLVVLGDFVSGAARRASAPPGPSRKTVRPYRLDGRRQPSPAGAPRPPGAGYGR